MFHLPLLNALKTFVVAGHYLNFTRAADDLLVSPSAVSHQIRILEDYLCIKLFVRQNRTLTLTDEGAHLHAALEGPFDHIARAIQNALQNRGTESLRIALRPFFSSAWLAPRLNAFWSIHPQIEIDLIHSIKMPNFMIDNIDLAIVWGKGNWPDMVSQRILPGNLTAICSASLLQEKGRPEAPTDLECFTLIHDEDRTAWGDWLRMSGASHAKFHSNLSIDDTNVRVQSTLNGQGVMLGCPALLKRELEQGELVQLFDMCLDTYGYYLVYPKKLQLTKQMEIFVNWILLQAGG
ncbi:LysR substrate-binding domain-containing protein [Pseudomonas fluorescens group sp. PF-1]